MPQCQKQVQPKAQGLATTLFATAIWFGASWPGGSREQWIPARQIQGRAVRASRKCVQSIDGIGSEVHVPVCKLRRSLAT
eukprot:102664-Pleurochrysis_carterae.AAC.1